MERLNPYLGVRPCDAFYLRRTLTAPLDSDGNVGTRQITIAEGGWAHRIRYRTRLIGTKTCHIRPIPRGDRSLLFCLQKRSRLEKFLSLGGVCKGTMTIKIRALSHIPFLGRHVRLVLVLLFCWGPLLRPSGVLPQILPYGNVCHDLARSLPPPHNEA